MTDTANRSNPTFCGFPLDDSFVRLVRKLYESKAINRDAALELLWYFK